MTRSAALGALALTAALAGVSPLVASAAPPGARPAPGTASAAAPARSHVVGKVVVKRPQCRRQQRSSTRIVRGVARRTCVAAPPKGHPVAPTALSTSPPTSAGVELSRPEARLLTLVNTARTQQGLAPLTATAGSTDVARRWSLQLARQGGLAHNPALVDDLATAGSGAWGFLAENVGSGPADDLDRLFAAYLASPHHRENILNPRAVFVGMGAVSVATADGPVLWNTMDFVDAYSPAYGPARTRAVDTVLALGELPAVLGR